MQFIDKDTADPYQQIVSIHQGKLMTTHHARALIACFMTQGWMTALMLPVKANHETMVIQANTLRDNKLEEELLRSRRTPQTKLFNKMR